MKDYTDFTNQDLKEFLSDNGFTRNSRRSDDEPQVLDYEKLSDILCCKQRQARNLIAGNVPIQRGHYSLLALHAGLMEPQLIAAQTSGSERPGAVSFEVSSMVGPKRAA